MVKIPPLDEQYPAWDDLQCWFSVSLYRFTKGIRTMVITDALLGPHKGLSANLSLQDHPRAGLCNKQNYNVEDDGKRTYADPTDNIVKICNFCWVDIRESQSTTAGIATKVASMIITATVAM